MKSLFICLLYCFFLSSNVMASSTHNHNDHKKMAKKKVTRKSLSNEAKKSLITVLEINEKLHNAFFDYDAKKVEMNSNKLSNAIDKIKDREIAKLLQFSKSKLAEIKAGAEREKNNNNYHLVSMALIHLVNKYDVGNKYNAYSCPMVKKKWVQNSAKMNKVHNPYAPEMPHCGTQDTKY